MYWFCRKGLPGCFFMIYTAFAMVGAFSFSSAESLRFISFERQEQVRDDMFNSPQDYCIPCPAEELVAAQGSSFSPRGGLQRFVFFWTLPDYGTNFYGPSPAAITGAQFFDAKNNILLKLRI
jgi:hypothetical protein